MSLSTRSVVPLAAILTAPLLAPLGLARCEAATAASVDRHPTTVVVRVYELGATRTPELTTSLTRAVTRLLERVDMDIDVQFEDCSRPQSCATVAPSAFVMRLTPGLHSQLPRQCGEASKGVGRQRGVLMTIFRGCIAQTRHELRSGALSEQGVSFSLMSLSEADILSAIVVHELIHLVLPDEVHGKGLFKATLQPRDWLDMASGYPQLDAALVSRLDRALANPPVAPTVLAERRVDSPPLASQPQQQQQ